MIGCGKSPAVYALALVMILVAAASGQTTWYVDLANCPGPGSGSAGDPFCRIQSGINASADGDTVIVADGTYTGTGNRNLNFVGRAITLRSANGAGACVIDCENQARGFVFLNGETADSVLEGFTITRGNGLTGGGGIFCLGSDPTVRGCVFDGNTASVESGGGMFNSSSDPTVIGCTFSGNTGGVGAGMANVDSDPTVLDCMFVDNLAFGDFGGGMYTVGGSPLVIGCTFRDNRTAAGGGMGIGGNGGGMYHSNSTPTLIDCTFVDNIAQIGGIGRGGGLFIGGGGGMVAGCTFLGNVAEFGGGAAFILTSPTVANCAFTANVAEARGGGMYNISNASPAVSGCTFTRNAAGLGGGMHNATNGDAMVRRCRFDGNVAATGGGMYNITSSDPSVDTSTFVGNQATSGGSAIHTTGNSLVDVTNCTLSANASGVGGAVIHNVSGGGSVLTSCIVWGNGGDAVFGDATATFSDVQGGFAGDGNLDSDPRFTRIPEAGADGVWGTQDDDYGDVRLLPDSPCIDAGDPEFVMADCDNDLEGHARVLCARVDMGAYEFGIGDFDCDGVVDLLDFAEWMGCMTGPGGGPFGDGCEAFDFDGNGDVDWGDFGGFQRAFGVWAGSVNAEGDRERGAGRRRR